MLPESLNTNQVKNAAGTEVEFIHKAYANDGSRRIYASTAEVYNLQHRLAIAHQELGTGADKRRRSMNQVLLELLGVSGVKRKITGTLSLDIPVGDLADQVGSKLVIANLLSFNASLGASTTILYDGTGSGAVALLDGSL